MTAANEAGPPGWLTFVIRSTLLSLLVFGAAAYPFFAWEGVTGVVVLAIGAGLELCLISISYGLLRMSFRRSVGIQYYAMLGGWIVRLGPTIAVLLALWHASDLPRMPVIASVMIFYLVLLFYEANVCWVAGSRK